MTADSTTDVSGSASLADIVGAASGAGAAVGAAQTSASQDSSTSYQRDIVKDIGIDERLGLESADRSSMTWLNGKRTYDLHQSLDAAAMLDKAKHQAKLDSLEMRTAEETLAHKIKVGSLEIAERQQDHAQRVRFADANSTVQIALLGDMAEKLGRIEIAVSK